MSLHKNDSTTVNELISKSIEIFSINGYAATHLTDITDALGISRGPIYYHFKDKLGLYKACYKKFDEDVRKTHSLRFSENKHIINFIEDVIFDCVSRTTRFNSNFFFGISAIEELSELSDLYDKLGHDIYMEKLNFINRAVEKGEIRRSDNPKQMVDLIYLIYFGLLSSLNTNLLTDYTEIETRNLIRVLLLGFEKHYCD